MCLLFCQRQTSYTDLKPLTHLSRADPSSDVEQDDLPPATAGEAPATAGEGWSSRIRNCGRIGHNCGGCRPADVLSGIKAHASLPVLRDRVLESAWAQ